MKKHLKFLIFILTLSFTMLCGCTKEEKETKILRLAETHPKDHVTAQADYEFAKLVEEKSNGSLIIEVHTDGELGAETKVLNDVYEGTLDFARICMLTPSEDSSIPEKIELPYLFKDTGHMFRAVEQVLGPQLDADLFKKNAKILAYMDSGSRNIYTKKPITKPEDFKGLRIRTHSVSNVSSDYFNMLGANPTPLDFNDILSSLEANTIDGAENNITSYYTSGQYKYAKYLLKADSRRFPDILIMNNTVYNELTPSEQDIIISCAKEASLHQRENWEKFENETEEKLRNEGCTITAPTGELEEFMKSEANFLYKHFPQENEEVTILEQVKAMK